MKKIFLCILCVLTIQAAGAFTDDLNQEFGLPDSGEFTVGYGAHSLTLDDGTKQMFYFLRMRPRFKLQKAEIGLDVTFNFNDGSRLRKEDWDSTADILQKIEYFKFGNPEQDKFFFRAGFLDGVTLGSGLLMERYSNKITFPEDGRKLGLDMGFAYSDDDYLRFMVNDINDPELYSLRLTLKPMDFVDVGFNYFLDTDADGDGPENTNLQAFSINASTPIFKNYADSLYVFQEIGKIFSHGLGFSTGLRMDFKEFKFRWEYRSFDPDFIPGYFDRFYEIEKQARFTQLNQLEDIGKRNSSMVGGIAYNILDSVFASASYERFFENSFRPRFHAELLLRERLADFLEVAATYDNKDADLANMSVNDANTSVIGQIRAKADKRVTIVYEYKSVRDENNEREITTGLETQVKF